MPIATQAHRITQVELKNFRGWGSRPKGEPRRITVDADIVLITGANGYGKSSLLEAVLLGLTGHREHRAPTKLPEGPADLCHRGPDGPAPGWSVALSVDIASGAPERHGVAWTSASTAASSDPGAPDPGLTGGSLLARFGEKVPPELTAGALSYFQESPRSGLDVGAHRSTLYRWFIETSAEVERVIEALSGRLEAVKAQQADATNKRNHAGITTGLLHAVEELYGWIGETTPPATSDALGWALDLARAALDWRLEHDDPAVSELRAAAVAAVNRLNSAARWRAGDGEALVSVLGALLRARIERASALDLQALREERDRIQAQLDRMLPEADLRALEEWADPTGSGAVDELLVALADGLPHWLADRARAERLGLGALTDELARLDAGKLRTLAASAAAAFTQGRSDLKGRGALQQRAAAIDAELEGRTFAARARELKQHLGGLGKALEVEIQRLAELERLPADEVYGQLISDLQALLAATSAAATDSRAATDKLAPLVHELLDKTLVRFAPRDGFLPVRMKEHALGPNEPPVQVLTLADGTTWADASTGQKAQLSLAWMLAQATALQSRLPARVLLLDDTSTAFDQGNLARQVTWLRQLAYNPDPDHRWQIFLASHHDELTSRLAELLRPPDGCSLQVLDFTGWQPGEGPRFRSYAMRPHEAVSTDMGPPEKRLEDALNRMWAPPLTRPAPSTGALR
jgi:hypothetical protein